MSRRSEPRSDRVRVVLAVWQYAEADELDAVKKFAGLLELRLGAGYKVRYRPDTGIVVESTVSRSGEGAGAVASVVVVLVGLERTLESFGPGLRSEIEAALHRITVKTNH